MKTPDPVSLSTVLEQEAGDDDHPCWINAPFEAYLHDISMKDGKFKAKLTDTLDDHITCTGTFGQRNIHEYTGMAIRIGGKGNILKEYNGHKYLQIGKGAEITFVDPNAKPVESKGEQLPAKSADVVPAPKPRNPNAIFGATAGMGTGKAIEYLAAKFPQMPPEELEPKLWEYASVIVRVSQRIEAGELVPLPEAEKKPNLPF